MIPVVVISYGHTLLADGAIKAAMAPVAAALSPVIGSTHPYMCLMCAFWLAYLPMGMRLLLQLDFSQNPLTMFGTGSGGFLPNTAPGKTRQNLEAPNPLAARLSGAHNNQMEGFPFFAAGVLACIQAGVDVSTVTDYCLLFLCARVAFIFFYIINVNNLIGNFRTTAWFVVMMVQAKLFVLAIAAA